MIYIILPVYCLSMINDGFDRYVFLIPLRLISPPSTTNIAVSNTDREYNDQYQHRHIIPQERVYGMWYMSWWW